MRCEKKGPVLLLRLVLLLPGATAVAELHAADQAETAATTTTTETAPSPPVSTTPHPAIPFARRDVERTAAQLKLATEKATAAEQLVLPAEQAASDAAAAKVAAEQALAKIGELIKLLEAFKSSSDKTVQASDAAIKNLPAAAGAPHAGDLSQHLKASADASKALSADAAKLLQERTAALKAAGEAKATAEQKIQETAAALKPLREAKAAADKLVAEAAAKASEATARLSLFEAAAPRPDPKQIRLVQTLQHTSPLLCCRIDAAGEYVYAGAQDNSTQRWDLFTGSPLPLFGHQSWVGSLTLGATGSPLVTAAYDGKVTWWNASAAGVQPARTIDAHKGFVRAVAISRDGKYLATCGNDRLIRIWRMADGSQIAELAGHESHVYNVAFHPDGRHLVSGDLMGLIKQWELSPAQSQTAGAPAGDDAGSVPTSTATGVETWRHVRDFDGAHLHGFDTTFVAHCGGIRGIDFSPDGRYLAVGGIAEVTNAFAGIGKPTALLFDWTDGKRLHVMQPAGAFTGAVWGLQFDPTGEFLVGAGGGGSGALWIWKLDQPKAVLDFKLPQTARGVCFHPDGLRIAVPLFDGSVRIYDLGPQVPQTAAK